MTGGRLPLHYLAGMGEAKPLFFIRGVSNCFATAQVDIQARDHQGDTHCMSRRAPARPMFLIGC